MMLVDVDHVFDVTQRSPLWSYRRWNIACLFDRDFLPEYEGGFRRKVHNALEDNGLEPNEGRIYLLANWRYFGYLINPVSCFYCLDEDDNLQYLLLEVTNTPWGERQVYALQCEPGRKFQDIVFEKVMHVSPFFAMDMHYHLKTGLPGEQLALNLDLYQGESKVFDATLSLSRKKLTSSHLFGVLIRYPFMTARVVVAIYWQALKLFVKKVPFQPHPSRYRKVQHENK